MKHTLDQVKLSPQRNTQLAHILSVVALICTAGVVHAQPTATAFTYQGELQDNGSPASGLHDVRFRLYDAASAGTQLGSTLCIDNVSLVNGRFLVQLDFGNQFAVPGRFLELDVRADTGAACNNSAGFVTLGPRQAVTSVPAASFAQTAATSTTANSAATAAIASNATNLNGQPASFYQAANNLTGTLADARLSTNVPRLNAPNTFTNGVSAPTFTGALNGNATTATTATTASNATNLNGQPSSFYTDAANLSAGVLADARLSTNIPRLNATNQLFTGSVAVNGGGSFGTGVQAGGIGLAAINPNAILAGAQLLWLSDQATLRVTGAGAGTTNGLLFGTPGNTAAMKLSNVGDLGIGTTTPESRLHVLDGSAGTVTASATTSAIFERSASNYVQIVSPAASERGVAFGSPNGNFLAGMYYTEGVGMTLRTGTNDTRVSIADTGAVDVAGPLNANGGLNIPTTERSVWIGAADFTSVINSGIIWGNFASFLVQSDILGGNGIAVATPRLPDNAVVRRVVLVCRDETPSVNATVRLRRFPYSNMQSTSVIATISSSGSAGEQTRSTTTIAAGTGVIDYQAYGYDLEVTIPNSSESLWIYGVRVDYQITTPLP